MKLIQVVDTTSNREATIKIYKTQMPDCEVPEMWIHILGGTYETEEMFDREWDELPNKDELQFFLSLDLLDSRKFTNALIEEIQNSAGKANKNE